VNIKLDENLSRHLKDQLLPLGHNVSTAFEEGLLGKVDVDVSAAAKGEDRMVFTLDLDFADLRKFPPGSHPGIILFRPRSMGPMAVNEFVLKFVRETELASWCVVSPSSNRTESASDGLRFLMNRRSGKRFP
jgi:predicted nuclease of predicted toxin-antitoxin system